MTYEWKHISFPHLIATGKVPSEAGTELEKIQQQTGTVGTWSLDLIRVSPVAIRERQQIANLGYGLDVHDQLVAQTMELTLDDQELSLHDFFTLLKQAPLDMAILEAMVALEPCALQVACSKLNRLVLYRFPDTEELVAELKRVFWHPGMDAVMLNLLKARRIMMDNES